MNSLAGAPETEGPEGAARQRTVGARGPHDQLLSAYSDFESQRVRKMFLAFSSKPEIFGDTTSLDTYQ